MPTSFKTFLVAIAFALSFSICIAKPVLADQKLKVGITIPLTGVVAPMGVALQHGITLFTEQHPEEAAKLEVIIDDHRYDGKSSANSCNKLSSVDKVDLMVVWGNMPSEVCATINERLKTPTLAISMNPDAKGREYVVTLGPRIESAVSILVDYFRALKAKHPVAVTIDIGSAVKGVNLTRDGLGGNMQIKIVAQNENDFKTIIASLKQQQVDAVLLFLIPEQAITFARQAVDLGFKVPLVGGDIFADESFQKNFTKLLPSLAFVYGAVEDNFVAEVTKRFGNASYIFETATGYAIMHILARISDYAKKEHPVNLIKSIEKIDLSGTPDILTLKNDAEFGLHVESLSKLYTAKRE